MRIAISGTHGAGKTTLAERLVHALPTFVLYEEPYHSLESEGRHFSHPPSLADFEAQFERSVETLLAARIDGLDCIFDRCPADFLAYAQSHKHADRLDLEAMLSRARRAMDALDLVLYVPIERPDRIQVPAFEGRELRRLVDERLQEMLLENRMKVRCAIREVAGSVDARMNAAMEEIHGLRRRGPGPGGGAM